MDYTEAVRLARAGDEQGFSYLYENTYESKYYLALQYMKNQDAAEDVLQDAYLKAFSKLDMLEQPEHFPAWLGQIVANTAKNALTKKNPLLFTDVAAEMEIEDFADRIEDNDVTGQPELSYTREETRALVRELIDALSEEQRICILLFHMEGVSIKEIAQTLECSENTVKSRLNYGRKNLKIKAEELQKKGYKLYSAAPLPLLLLLLRTDQHTMLTEGSIQAAGHSISDYVFARIPALHTASGGTGGASEAAKAGESQGAAATAGATGAAKAGAGGAAKAAFLHTVAGKVIVAVLGICIAGGVVYGITRLTANRDAKEEPRQESQAKVQEEPESTQEEAESTQEEPESTQEEPEPAAVADEDYPELIEGNLTKEELEFVFAYGPETLTEQGLSDQDYLFILDCLCLASRSSGKFIPYLGYDANYRSAFSADTVNRYFSSFTDYRFTEENDSDAEYGVDVDGSTLWMYPAELNFEAEAAITDAAYLEDTMIIHFTYEKDTFELGLTTAEKTATLKRNEAGNFQIITIEEGYLPLEVTDVEAVETETSDKGENTDSIRAIYEGVLQSVQNQEAGYEFPNAGGSTEFQYFLWDMNGDGIKELVVGTMCTADVFTAYDVRVFTVTYGSSGYTLKAVDGDVISTGIYLPEDGNGLYTMELSRGTGRTDIYRITIGEDTLTKGNSPELTYTMGDSTGTQFINSNSYPEWISISNPDGLNEL